MDFTGMTGFITTYAVDEETGFLTITFRDLADTVTIGEIIIEENRARAIFDSLHKIQEARWSNFILRQNHKTLFDLNAEKGSMEFV